ncbi:hypothetical protein P3T73_15440 [Kiritimatiellota bacterium B12222]|nr:hypothetical protein P3T73_15440 [Kiritimatiellota bacterium B12222]
MRNSSKVLLSVLLLFPFIIPAVLINSLDGSGNTTAPLGGQGWNYVGRITGSATSSVTYVGNNWFITANHVKVSDTPTSIYFNGHTHNITQWSNQLSYGMYNADLVMFRVDGSIAVPNITLHSDPIVSGTNVTMIGNGRNRQVPLTTWHIGTDPGTDVWSESVSPDTDLTREGYKWGTGSSKRWGTNEVALSNLLLNDGYGTSVMFSTTFDDAGGSNEAQGATYDSGGGVFIQNGSAWELAGMMVAVDRHIGQPASTSVYGNPTYSVDLSYYQAEIESILVIPEVSSLQLSSLMLLVCALICCRLKKSPKPNAPQT